MTIPNVRAAEIVDVPELVALMTEFYAESGFSLPSARATETFEQLIRDPRLGRVWLLGLDRQLAGYVVLTVAFSMECGGLRGFVDDLFVRPPYRGRGLGTLALAEVRRTCLALGVRALLAEVGLADEAAQRLYRRSGLAGTGNMLMAQPLTSPVHAAQPAPAGPPQS